MSRHARRAVAAILITLAITTMATGPVAARFPGRNGQITFHRHDTDGYSQIWVANPDLTHQRQITSGPYNSAFPTWSPDASRIAFASDRTDPDPTDDIPISDIFTMRLDGTDVRQITESPGDSETPDWSPDGRWLLFAAEAGYQHEKMGIYIVRSDGSGVARQLTRVGATSPGQELPRFSPNGKHIEYTDYRLIPPEHPGDPEVEQTALIVMRPDGSDARRITPWALRAADADWSPDGRRLVFAQRLEEHDLLQSVAVVDSDGRHLRAMTHGDGVTGEGADLRFQESFNPVWAPDGTLILFARASYTDADGLDMGLMTMRPDGSHLAFVSDLHGEEHQPEWGTAPIVP
jgi:Tol biopolymer transport system component